MKTSWNDIELIERYLDGLLRGAELIAFQARLEKESALKADIRAQAEVRSLVRRHHILGMRTRAKHLHQLLYNDPARRQLRRAIEALFN